MADEITSLNKNKKKFDVFKYFKQEWLSDNFTLSHTVKYARTNYPIVRKQKKVVPTSPTSNNMWSMVAQMF